MGCAVSDVWSRLPYVPVDYVSVARRPKLYRIESFVERSRFPVGESDTFLGIFEKVVFWKMYPYITGSSVITTTPSPSTHLKHPCTTRHLPPSSLFSQQATKELPSPPPVRTTTGRAMNKEKEKRRKRKTRPRCLPAEKRSSTSETSSTTPWRRHRRRLPSRKETIMPSPTHNPPSRRSAAVAPLPRG